jgi:hypothetical protein
LAALLVALLSRVVIATPLFTLSEIRAATCCTKDCPGAGTPYRCCEYRREAGDPATVAVKAAAPAVFTVVPAVLSPLDRRTAIVSRHDQWSERATGPPRFLQLRVLRL